MPQKLSVVDLFSGAGGMSCGFQRHSDFLVAGAVDAQIGKPSAPAAMKAAARTTKAALITADQTRICRRSQRSMKTPANGPTKE